MRDMHLLARIHGPCGRRFVMTGRCCDVYSTVRTGRRCHETRVSDSDMNLATTFGGTRYGLDSWGFSNYYHTMPKPDVYFTASQMITSKHSQTM